jgi:acetoin utilization protein AcuC
LRPARVILTRELIKAYGIVDGERVTETPARDASFDELRLVHTERYIDAVTRAGHGEGGHWSVYGFGPGDNPIFPQMHEASARVAGASLSAAEAVVTGRAEHAFNPAGGLHHAMPERAGGFCVYDDPAIAMAWLLQRGIDRIAYVDVDVHHGDGPQAIFYRDSRVLTISLHQYGRIFPGTGDVAEIGAGKAEGTKVNVPLPASTTDEEWLAAFRAVVPPLVKVWKPDVLVTQLGCDTHFSDPLAELALSTNAYRETALMLHELAHEAAGGKWVATGGGGYQWARVVPRAWTIYFAEMAEAKVPDEIPEEWIEVAEREAGYEVPATLSEPKTGPGNPSAVNHVIERVRQRIFPTHGLPG